MTATEKLTSATSKLTSAVYGLLPYIHDVLEHHAASSNAAGCTCHASTWPCRDLGTAIAALDLVLHVRLAARSTAAFQTGAAADHRQLDTGPLARGLERLRAEIACRHLSPDGSIAIMTILAAIDTAHRILATESNAPDIFAYGVLLGMLDRTQDELTNLDPER